MPTVLPTRELFEQQRAAARNVERRDGRVLVIAGVGLGVAQLLFLRWAEGGNLARAPRTTIAVTAFLAYMALVIFLIVRRERRLRAARPACPGCGVRLKGLSERIASATGRCDRCGASVFATARSGPDPPG